jgi:hypothetical protein
MVVIVILIGRTSKIKQHKKNINSHVHPPLSPSDVLGKQS